MTMQTTYKKHTIDFREDEEEWFCEAIGVKKTLKAMKAAIDNLSRKDRQLGVKALMLERDYRGDDTFMIVEVTVTVLCEPRKVYRSEKEEVDECWIVNDGSRSKVRIAALFPLSSRTKLTDYIAEKSAHDKEGRRLDGVCRGLPSFDADSLALAAKEKEPAK